MNVTEKQQKDFINQINKNDVEWIILSNRYSSDEMGLGVLGKTHCKTLAQYIFSEFEEVKRFGDFDKSTGQVSNHGMIIMKKK